MQYEQTAGALMKTSEAAKKLGLSRRSLRMFIRRGLLRGVTLGGREDRCYWVTRESVDRLVKGDDGKTADRTAGL